MNPAMMNPDMMKAASDMMSKMSPDEMERMMSMAKNMDPSMMQQAQQMMSNPQYAQQAQAAMKNMSSDDIKARMNMAAASAPAPKAAPAPVSVVAKLRASAMSVPEEALSLVEEAEGLKASGNASFKKGEYPAAISEYKKGATVLGGLLEEGSLSGSDKQAVVDLLNAMQLNSANCRLKRDEFSAAVEECDAVLSRGANRKALFQRGKARLKLGQLQGAHADLKDASAMDPADQIVIDMLREVEKKLNIPESSPPPAAASSSSVVPPAAHAAMPKKADGSVDHEAVEKMMDSISPDQMKQQAAMLDGMTPEQLQAVAPQLGGMDPQQVKAMSKMMSNMDPDTMKSMAKMATQMGASGVTPGAAAASASSAVSAPKAAASAMADSPHAPKSLGEGLDMMSNMSPDMMKAGMDMMKNMDPKMMANMSKMMGREISEDQMKQMQGMMDKMSPEDMQKWSQRAAKVAGWAKGPMKVYQACRGYVARLGSSGALAIVAGMLAVMAVGHFTDTF